ncbi:MAG: hypothetical protein IJ711_00240 [Lachnospiraceae bacterium]|nr:hypothetical protein [Clostridia bacterium]MBR1691184.1 hypothetical protein [Lachnospiraceae bacterium]
MPNPYEYQQIHDQKLAESICVAAIVSVTAFDPAGMTVNVQPLSKSLSNGKYESQPPILGVPVAVTRCGGFIFRPWYKPGDVGVVVYLDHDIDGALAGGTESVPATRRNHSASDAVFIGGIVSGKFTAKGLPDDAIALAKEDGSVYVAVTESDVKIKGDLEVDGKITATGDVFAEKTISGAHHTHGGGPQPS